MQAEHMSDFREMVSAAVAQGWTVSKTKACHWKFRPPDKKYPPYYSEGSPGNPRRFIINLRVSLRKRGLAL
jgi:hypothetical protein